jgi:hypothetical protein
VRLEHTFEGGITAKTNKVVIVREENGRMLKIRRYFIK